MARSPAPDAIRAARRSAGHTQTEAAELVGAAYRTWQDWEAGLRQMPAAAWEVYLLRIDRHPDHRLTPRNPA